MSDQWQDLPRSTKIVCWAITIFWVWLDYCLVRALLEMT
jgi:hypothetical protein